MTSETQKNAYDFEFNDLLGRGKIRLSDYQGKVIVVVNTASQCGFTKQYKGLEELHQKYKDRGLVIIGVPCNDFGSQEPGDPNQIASFCEMNYGVTFLMTEKYCIKGPQAHPFYVWAKNQLGFGTGPKWNFHKYLINRRGDIVQYFHSMSSPTGARFVEAVESLLNEELG